MTRGEFLNRIVDDAKEYCPGALKSVLRNCRMSNINENDICSQEFVEALLVDFINFIAKGQCIDLGLYTKHLHEPKLLKDVENDITLDG